MNLIRYNMTLKSAGDDSTDIWSAKIKTGPQNAPLTYRNINEIIDPI